MGHALAGRYKLASPVAETEDLRDGGFEARVEEAWFSAKVDRKALKALMRRSDKESPPAFRNVAGISRIFGHRRIPHLGHGLVRASIRALRRALCSLRP